MSGSDSQSDAEQARRNLALLEEAFAYWRKKEATELSPQERGLALDAWQNRLAKAKHEEARATRQEKGVDK